VKVKCVVRLASAAMVATLLMASAVGQAPAAASPAKSAPAGKRKIVVVAADGTGQFKTVQEAVDSAPDGNIRIDIKPGEYRVLIMVTANDVELRGLGRTPQDTVLVYDNSAGTAGGTGKSGTIMVTGDDFHAENLTIANDFEKRHERSNQGSQAVALHVTGDREIFRHVRFLGFQDTLYADSKSCHTPGGMAGGGASPCQASRQYYADCYIEGHVDFIFGDAKAVFDRCEIHAITHQIVTLTAQSRVYPAEDSGYLFLNCTVTADAGATNILLGRPWRAYSTVIFMNTDFKAKLNPAGWSDWDGKLKTSSYAEYGSHGLSGDAKDRIAGTRVLTAAEASKITAKSWLAGADSWVPQGMQ